MSRNAAIPAILTSCVAVSPQELSGLRGNAVSAIGRSGGSRADKERFLEDNRKTVREGHRPRRGDCGAVAGGVAGYYLGGESASAAIGGAMVGGALGGIGGAAAGRSKAAKKAVYERRESNLDGAIASARAYNRAARDRVNSAKQNLSKLKARAATAKASGNKSELASIKRQVNSEANSLGKQAAGLDSKISSGTRTLQSAGKSNSDYSAYNSAIADLKSTKSDTETMRQQLGSLGNSL
jgi:hypothetical protein